MAVQALLEHHIEPWSQRTRPEALRKRMYTHRINELMEQYVATSSCVVLHVQAHSHTMVTITSLLRSTNSNMQPLRMVFAAYTGSHGTTLDVGDLQRLLKDANLVTQSFNSRRVQLAHVSRC